jgi:hypothetical protein
MLLHKIYKRVHENHCTNGEIVKEGCKVSVEQILSTCSGCAERKNGNNDNTSISRLEEDIPDTCRCINHNTWSYFGATRSRRIGSSDSIC